MNVMVVELDGIDGREQRSVHLENEELDLLLFDFLESMIYYKDAENLLLRARKLRLLKSLKFAFPSIAHLRASRSTWRGTACASMSRR